MTFAGNGAAAQRAAAPDYEALLGPVGAFGGLVAGNRTEAWRQRLKANEPELEAFHRLPACDMPMHRLPAPTWRDTPLRELPAVLGGAAGHAREVLAGRRSAADWVDEALEAAHRHAHMNLFVALRGQARDEARAVDAARAAGDPQGPLAGVPIGVKDLLAVAGCALTGGTRASEARPADHDAEAVRRLRAAGAIVLGTTNLHELAYGITSDNPHFGRVLNPRSPGHMAGGSSGGSAAAVAAGIVPIAIGSDAAGSIRIPAACCGVVGFKPSFDAVPREGVIDLAVSLDHVGPLGACVDDVIAAHALMSGRAPGCQVVRESLAGLKLLRLGGYFERPLADTVGAAVRNACSLASRDGAAILRGELPLAEIAASLQFVTICAEATDQHWQRLHERPAELGAEVRLRLEIGQFIFGRDYVKAQRWRARLHTEAMRLFRDVDLLVCATLPTTAPPAGAGTIRLAGVEVPVQTAMTELTLPFNLLGWPAISLPFGEDENGLPIGLQLVGPAGADERVLGAARRLEVLRRTQGGQRSLA